jgi:TusA-related sulfurtransferase
MTTFVDLDVRPALRAGGEPFEEIITTVNALKPGEGLRLLATFKPIPLFHVLGAKGFTPVATELDGGEWEVLFTPSDDASAAPSGATAATPSDGADWPPAVRHLDNRDLDPPEPMVRILETVEAMAPGEVLSALLCREPIFLFPELAKRGHRWHGAFEDDGKTYKVLIRVGTPDAAAWPA